MKPQALPEQVKKRLEKCNQFAHGSVMFRRRSVETVGAYREEFRVAQDYDLWLRISERFDVANIPEFLYRWRLNFPSQSVKSLNAQNVYASLASELAAERRSGGADRLQKMSSPEERASWTREYLEAGMREAQGSEALGYNKWAGVFLDSGNPGEALRFIVRSLSLEPFRFETWKLLCRAGKRIAGR
jgi:hypothetical protein